MGMKSEFFPNILSQNFFANFLKKIVKNVLTLDRSRGARVQIPLSPLFSQNRELEKMKKLLTKHYGCDKLNKLFQKEKIKKFLTDKLGYDNINELSKTAGSTLITKQ